MNVFCLTCIICSVFILVLFVAFIVSKIKESKKPKCETCKYRKDCDEVNHKDFCEAQHCGVEYTTFCNVRRAPCIKTNTCQLDDYCCEYYEKRRNNYGTK